MKIAIWHNLPSGGGKRALYDHVRGLLARGHTVEVWCPPTADQQYLPLNRLVPEHIVPLPWPQPTRTPLALLRWNVMRRLQAMDRHTQQCAAEINEGGFDLLIAHSCRFFFTTPIGRYTNLPNMIYLQEPCRWLYEAMPVFPWAAIAPPTKKGIDPAYIKRLLIDQLRLHGRRIQVREEIRNARAFDMILVNSLFSRESILRAYGLDAKVCYLGIDPTKFVDRQQPKEHYVIGVGAFVPTKNISLVIDALGLIEHDRPRLVWIGNAANPSYLAELQQHAHDQGVAFDPRVDVDDAELIDLLNRARMMVYAPRLEPFGYAPLEANACGLPVVAVAEGGVRETIVDQVNGLLVEHDAQTLAHAIQRLIDDPAYAQQLGQAGATCVREQWSLDQAIDRLEQRIYAVCGGSLAQPLHSNTASA